MKMLSEAKHDYELTCPRVDQENIPLGFAIKALLKEMLGIIKIKEDDKFITFLYSTKSEEYMRKIFQKIQNVVPEAKLTKKLTEGQDYEIVE